MSDICYTVITKEDLNAHELQTGNYNINRIVGRGKGNEIPVTNTNDD